MAELNSGETMLHFPALPMIGWLRLNQGAIVENKRLGHVLAAAKLVQDKRDDTRSLSVPTTHRTRKKDPSQEAPTGTE